LSRPRTSREIQARARDGLPFRVRL
jgi:hypothetical protein